MHELSRDAAPTHAGAHQVHLLRLRAAADGEARGGPAEGPGRTTHICRSREGQVRPRARLRAPGRLGPVCALHAAGRRRAHAQVLRLARRQSLQAELARGMPRSGQQVSRRHRCVVTGLRAPVLHRLAGPQSDRPKGPLARRAHPLPQPAKGPREGSPRSYRAVICRNRRRRIYRRRRRRRSHARRRPSASCDPTVVLIRPALLSRPALLVTAHAAHVCGRGRRGRAPPPAAGGGWRCLGPREHTSGGPATCR